MSAERKFEGKADEVVGKAKEGLGGATGDEQMQAEGRGDQVKGGLKQAGEKVKDAARKVKDAVTGK